MSICVSVFVRNATLPSSLGKGVTVFVNPAGQNNWEMNLDRYGLSMFQYSITIVSSFITAKQFKQIMSQPQEDRQLIVEKYKKIINQYGTKEIITGDTPEEIIEKLSAYCNKVKISCAESFKVEAEGIKVGLPLNNILYDRLCKLHKVGQYSGKSKKAEIVARAQEVDKEMQQLILDMLNDLK